jgi:hypothetical protein
LINVRLIYNKYTLEYTNCQYILFWLKIAEILPTYIGENLTTVVTLAMLAIASIALRKSIKTLGGFLFFGKNKNTPGGCVLKLCTG